MIAFERVGRTVRVGLLLVLLAWLGLQQVGLHRALEPSPRGVAGPALLAIAGFAGVILTLLGFTSRWMIGGS